MQKTIAVILNENNHVTEITDARKISIYHKSGEEWTKRKEITLPELFQGGMADIRKKLGDVIGELDDCKIIAGKSVTGLVYNALSNAGFIIAEIDEFKPAVLDGLYSDILKEIDALHEEAEVSNIPTSPVETGIKGNYFFDFSLLKNSGLSYSSKTTILPFLNSVRFNQLEILCDHVMPWFEPEMKKRNLLYTVTETDNGKICILVKTADGQGV